MSKIQGIHYPAEFKNLAINGNFDFWQRTEGTTITVSTTSGINTQGADMWAYQSGSGASTHSFTIQRSTSVPSLAQSGFSSTYSALFTMTTGLPSPAAADYVCPFEYRVEGLDYARIHGKVATFGFWVNASIAGTYSFALENGSQNRTYLTTFTVAGANTWQFVSLTVTLDSAGSWNFDNTIGLKVFIGSVGGSTYTSGTLNQWQAGNFVYASTATNYQATTGATLAISQFSIVEGPLGFSSVGFQRCGKDIQQELTLCQRYFEKTFDIGQVPTAGVLAGRTLITNLNTTTTVDVHVFMPFKATKRVIPTMTGYISSSGIGSPAFDNVGTQGGTIFNTLAASARNAAHWTADAGL